MSNNVTRDDIAEYLFEKFGLSKSDCQDLVNDIINEIILGLSQKKNVKIHNFGTFKLRHKKPRVGRNPKTKEEVTILERNVISFIPSKHILSFLNDNKKIDESKKI